MTTLAIIGSGIAGRSLIYTLAKEKKAFSQILLFSSESMARACSYRSTAIVAPRGLSQGHSELGNLLFDSFKYFEDHFKDDHPLGVEKIKQYTGSQDRIEEFKTRYPLGELSSDFTVKNIYIQKDHAYLIDPATYLDFLLNTAISFYGEKLKVIDDFVIEASPDGKIHTQNGKEFFVDKLIHTSGVYNRFWEGLAPESKLKTIKASQGAYFEFNNYSIPSESFSLTLDGHNFIWNKKMSRLLIGSTTLEVNHEIPPIKELEAIYNFFKSELKFSIPDMDKGRVQVGIREKAQKRSPYFFNVDKCAYLGGFYKNGYTLGLSLSKKVSESFL